MKIHILQHHSFETPGIILHWAAQNGYQLTYTFLFEAGINFPPASEFDLLIIMGGTMGVYQEDMYPWLKLEKQFIKHAIAADKVVLGICLGSQLLAEALGARVYAAGFNEIGFFPVQKTGAGQSDTLMDHIPESWTVFHWHGDSFDLPAGAVHLLSSTACRHQAFRLGKCVGLQFHPEVDTPLLQDMFDHERHELVEAEFVQSEAEMMNRPANPENKQYLFGLLDKLVALA